MAQTSGLTVRNFQRNQIDLPAEFVIADAHRTQVRFSGSSASLDQHTLRGRAVDISPGGVGLQFSQFLPRMCEGEVRIFNPAPIGTKPDGSPSYAVAFTQPVKVRRVFQAGPEPTYFVGTSYLDPDPALQEQIASILSALNIVPGAGGGDA
jgi:c-di-GMP-binding flagellar brake protein YcgR